MPCYDSRDHYSWEDIEKARKAADENARMACEACHMIEAMLAGEHPTASKELKLWWWQHKLTDAVRKNRVADYKRKLP